ncbi:MAG: phospholipase A [Azoarcus sp.]|jgi:outer membrane phospholipase A|nr:phospholipase A [Azoarcus sp.]
MPFSNLASTARIAFFACFLSAWMSSAHALDWLLAAPTTQVVPGQVFEVIVIGEPANKDWPKRLSALIEQPGSASRLIVELSAAGEPATARQRYVGQWPAEIEGTATLALADAAGARLLLEAAPTISADAKPSDSPQEAAAESSPSDSALAAAPETATVSPQALSFHEPMYFVFGGNSPKAARYQISFRYRIFDDYGIVSENLPVARGLYFGYTQTSLWDLGSESKPFRDTSYRPSLFYQWKISNPPLGDSLALSGGYEHESNGRDGEKSRSIDTLFARAEWRYRLSDNRTYIGIEPKFWFYLDKDENPDIQRYRGYAQLGLRVGRDDGLMLATLLRRGTSGANSVQADLSYPIRQSMFSGVGTFVQLQYFRGYGETLLEYNESRRSQFRLGIAFVR